MNIDNGFVRLFRRFTTAGGGGSRETGEGGGIFICHFQEQSQPNPLIAAKVGFGQSVARASFVLSVPRKESAAFTTSSLVHCH